MSYCYIQSKPDLWTVGFYDPSGKWVAESDHGSTVDAAERVYWLNGGTPCWEGGRRELLEACEFALKTIEQSAVPSGKRSTRRIALVGGSRAAELLRDALAMARG